MGRSEWPYRARPAAGRQPGGARPTSTHVCRFRRMNVQILDVPGRGSPRDPPRVAGGPSVRRLRRRALFHGRRRPAIDRSPLFRGGCGDFVRGVPGSAQASARPTRRDAWWVQPLVVFLVLSAVHRLRHLGGVPGRALHLRPVPLAVLLAGALRRLAARAGSGRSRRGGRRWLPFSPALLILWAPGGFRFTCYYYRGAYYKAFWADPPACAVGEPRKSYRGERSFPLILQNVHRYFLYLALVFIVLLAYDVWKALWFTDPPTGGTAFGIGVGTLVLAAQRRPPRRLHASAATRCATWSAACSTSSRGAPVRTGAATTASSCLNRRHMLWAWMSLFWVGVRRRLRAAVLDGRLDRLEDPLMARVSRRTSTTCWSSAPAAPACAPRSRPRPAGVSVGLVCKSLLGKAHTVMAEGGIAAALANVDDRDSWRVHFADTMRGGQYLNNWRMAELHAKEAPDRVRELEAWGAVFDRTQDGRILQRNFGGHRYPRLAHVGDRTGLEMIRTLQDHGIHQGIDVHMECTVARAAQGRRPRRRRVRLRPRARPLPRLPRQGGRARHRRHRPRLQDHQQQLGVHRRRPRAGLSTPAPS